MKISVNAYLTWHLAYKKLKCRINITANYHCYSLIHSPHPLLCVNYPQLHHANVQLFSSNILRVYFINLSQEHTEHLPCSTLTISGQHLNSGKFLNPTKEDMTLYKESHPRGFHQDLTQGPLELKRKVCNSWGEKFIAVLDFQQTWVLLQIYMYVYIYIYIYIYIHTHIYTYTHTYIYTYAYIYRYRYIER